MRTNPSIDDPSNTNLLSSAFSSWLRGISTFLMVPSKSVNCSRIYRTFSSSTIFMISSRVYLPAIYQSPFSQNKCVAASMEEAGQLPLNQMLLPRPDRQFIQLPLQQAVQLFLRQIPPGLRLGQRLNRFGKRRLRAAQHFLDAGDVHPFFHQCLDLQQRSEEHTSELQSRENLICRL